jgi:hypothetical protein
MKSENEIRGRGRGIVSSRRKHRKHAIQETPFVNPATHLVIEQGVFFLFRQTSRQNTALMRWPRRSRGRRKWARTPRRRRIRTTRAVLLQVDVLEDGAVVLAPRPVPLVHAVDEIHIERDAEKATGRQRDRRLVRGANFCHRYTVEKTYSRPTGSSENPTIPKLKMHKAILRKMPRSVGKLLMNL